MEIWKDIPGFEGYYKISNYGNVLSLPRVNTYGRKVKGGILAPKVSKKGYLFVHLCKGGKQKIFRIHRLVAMQFLPNPTNDSFNQIDHIDRDKKNNTSWNLRWVDNRTNSRNTKRNTMLTIDGESRCIAEWAEISGISAKTIQRRIGCGWNHKDAVFKELRRNKDGR